MFKKQLEGGWFSGKFFVGVLDLNVESIFVQWGLQVVCWLCGMLEWLLRQILFMAFIQFQS